MPDSLAGLHDVVTPPVVSYAPQTVGWLVLAGGGLLLLGWLGWRTWRHARANRYRKAALKEMDRIEAGLGGGRAGPRALSELNAVLKRTALTAWSRPDVASLAGEGWLEFLDETAGGEGFRRGPGRALADRVYWPPGAGTVSGDVSTVFGVARHWVRHHRAPSTAANVRPTRAGKGEDRRAGEAGA